MSRCLIAAVDPAVREPAVRAVEASFERTTRTGFGDLPMTVARERPDVVVVVADAAPPTGSGSAWTTAMAELAAAAPDLAVLVTAAPPIARDAERRLAVNALTRGARGYLRANPEPGPVPSRAGEHPSITRLSDRELQVLRGMTDGLTNGAIAAELFLSEDTVKTHIRRLFRKLGATDRAHAVARGFRQGLLR